MEESKVVANTDLKFISDHTDERDKLPDDSLGREDMVNAIAKAITQVDPPFTFGIYGSWGSGKTHFMKSVKERLDNPKLDKTAEVAETAETAKTAKKWNPEIVTVMFESWRHQRDKHPEISMLNCLRMEIDKRDSKYKKGKKVKKISRAWKDVLVGLIPTIMGLNLQDSIKGYKKSLEKQKEMDFEIIDEHTHLKEKFNELFNEVVGEKKDVHRPVREKFDKLFQLLVGKKEKPKRIVFFIDDLDRCIDSTVIKMLEQIKLFLWNEHCVFVLGADHKVIEGVVVNGKYAQGRKYLEKIVNFPFYLPPLGNTGSDSFFKGKIIEDKEKLTTEDQDLVKLFRDASIDSKANLRQMILLANTYKFNNYLTSIAIKQEFGDDAQYSEQITAVVTVLQTLHEDAFNILCENRSGSEEGENLKAFFTKPTEASSDPINWLFSPKGSDPDAAASKEIQGIDLDAINGIREWAWDHCSELIQELAGKDLLVYVRFLVSQIEAKNSSEDSNRGLAEASWVWYEKSVPTNVSSDVVVFNEISALPAWIKENTKESSSISYPIMLDNYLWRVIDIEKDTDGRVKKALLLSKDIIGYGPMDNTPEDWKSYKYSWSKSALHKKLNSKEWLEKHLPTLNASGMIQKDHPLEDGDDSGPLGKVFLLSAYQANKYFEDDAGRIAKNAKDQAGWWWLRSPGSYTSKYAAYVTSDGSVHGSGNSVLIVYGGVRPALWLNLESLNL